jgi:hypothetical protein
MRTLKMLKLYTIVKNNLGYFLLYYQAYTPENDTVSAETCRGNHEFNLFSSRTSYVVLVDCTVIINDIMDYNGAHYYKINILNK